MTLARIKKNQVKYYECVGWPDYQAMVSLEEDEFEAQPKKIKFFRRYIQLLFHQFDIQFRFYFFNENCPLTFIHKSEGSRQYSTTQKSNKIIKCLYMTATMFI